MRPIILTTLLLTLATQAQANEYVCPQVIDTRQMMQDVPQGWQSYEDTQSSGVLESVSLFDGPPSGMADLKPDNGDTAEVNQVWSFNPPASNLWLRCNYANTRMTLAMQLPSGFTTCTAERDASVTVGGQPEVKHVVCSGGTATTTGNSVTVPTRDVRRVIRKDLRNK